MLTAKRSWILTFTPIGQELSGVVPDFTASVLGVLRSAVRGYSLYFPLVL